VNALAELGREDVYGVWIGDGPLRAKTQKLAARRGLAGRMAFLGERTDVNALLPGLDVFAMASRYEGLPCAIVEAMAAARPVVATAVNAVPNIVVAGETGLLVPPGRPELLSRALRHLIGNPAVAARLPAGSAAGAGGGLGDDGRRVAGIREGVRGLGRSAACGGRQFLHGRDPARADRPRPPAWHRGPDAHPDLLRCRPGHRARPAAAGAGGCRRADADRLA